MVFIHSARFLQIFKGDLTTTMCRLVSASSTTYHSNMSPSVTPVIFIITATVQEKKKKENQQTCHRVYGRDTHTSTYYPTNMSSQVRALSTCSLAIPWSRFDGEWHQHQLAQELPCRSNSDRSTAKLSRTPLLADKNDLGLQLHETKPKQQYFVWQEGCSHRGWALCIEGMGWTRPHTHHTIEAKSIPKQRSRQAYATRAQTNFLSSGYKEVKSRNKHASNSKQTHEKHAKKNDLNGATRASSMCSCRYQTDAINKTQISFFFQTALLP